MRRLLGLSCAVTIAAFLAACGGGGSSSAPSAGVAAAPTPSPVPVPVVTPAPSPTGAATTTPTPAPAGATFGPIPAFVATPIAVTPASGGTTIGIAPINGIAGALTLGQVDPANGLGTSYAVTLSNAPAAGVPDFAQVTPGVRGEILYLLLAPPAGVNYLGGAALSVSLPPRYQGASTYKIALYVAGPNINPAWPSANGGITASSVSNGTVSFQFPSLTLAPNFQYSIVLYAI